MTGCDKRSQIISCYQKKLGSSNADATPCQCNSKNSESKYSDDKMLEMEKETEEELEDAKRMLKNTENVVRQSRNGGRSCNDQTGRAFKKPAGKSYIPASPCKSNELSSSREALKRLSKVTGKDCERHSGKYKGKSQDIPSAVLKLTATCKTGNSQKETKELPKKPALTSEQLDELIEQETKDVESAWILALENRETYKKPCPKQQRARDAIKALIEPKKEDISACLVPAIFKEPPPLVDPDPEDISPEVAANMMYTQERGIKMISCPEETVRHLFPQQFGIEEKEKEKDKPVGKKKGDEEVESESSAVVEEAEEVDHSAYTRNMSQQKELGEEDRSSSKYYDQTGKSYDKKREFLLQERTSKCINKVQLRGNFSQWFPGYFVAFPDQGDQGVQLAKSPSSVFQRAWMVSKPNNIPETDLYVIE